MTLLLRPSAVFILLALLQPALHAANPAPIKIGEIASLTGKEAAFGQSSHKGTLLAIEELNAAAGVLGRPLQLITEDNQSKAGESATAARKLISRDQVAALLGEVASSRSLEIAPIAQSSKIPMVSPASTNPKVTAVGSYVFRVCFIDPFQGTVMAKFAHEDLALRRVAMLTSVSSAYSVGLSKFFKERFVSEGGEIAIEQKYSEGDKDFRAQLTAIKASGVGGIFIPGYYSEVALIAKQARELGITASLFGGDGWEAPQLLAIGGDSLEGCYYSTHYSAEDTASAVQRFVTRYKARFGGEMPDAMAALGYDSAFVLADAIKRAGNTEPEALRDALAATRDYVGVTGRTTIDKERNAAKAAVVVAIKYGRLNFFKSVEP